MHRKIGNLWLLAGFVALALARPLPARAVGDPDQKIARQAQLVAAAGGITRIASGFQIKLVRQAQLVAAALDRLAVLLNFSFIGDADQKRAALDAIAAAQAALARLIDDPSARDAQMAAIDATDFALMAVARFLGGPDTGPEPHLGQIFGAFTMAEALFHELVRLLQ